MAQTQLTLHTDSMDGPAVNSSFSASVYYWAECNTYAAGDGVVKMGRPSVGLLILFITHCFEFFVGVPSNLWLVCHILRKRSKVTGVLPADFFPLHLALTQLSFYLILPVIFANHYLWQSDLVLDMMTFLNSMVLVMKPLLLCMTCVERYMAVVRPLDYRRFRAHKYRWGCLGASWCIYFFMATAAVFGRTSTTLCMLFLPILAIDTFCCLSVLKTLQKPLPGDKNLKEKKKKAEEKGKTHKNVSRVVQTEEGTQEQSRRIEEGKEEKGEKAERSDPRGKGERYSVKKKAFITIVIIQALLTLNYVPFIITLPMNGRVPAQTLKCQFMAMALAAAACCTYLQPLLYLQRLRRLPCMTPRNT